MAVYTSESPFSVACNPTSRTCVSVRAVRGENGFRFEHSRGNPRGILLTAPHQQAEWMKPPNRHLHNELNRDELDHLLRGALMALVGQLEPPPYVWKRIELALKAPQQPDPPRHRFRMPWLSLALQPILALLLVVLGGIGLQAFSRPDAWQYSADNTPPPVATAYGQERSAPARGVAISEERDLYLLKTRQHLAARPEADPMVDLTHEASPPKQRAPAFKPSAPVQPGPTDKPAQSGACEL